ncbi:MAG TPA: hypothetical protein VM096_10700 [Vicinamibacterales bacterium]|nr:hypothetical protein [Vicinamibacterales bacterium]
MKTILKIVVALVLVITMFNAGRAAFNNYAFEDAVHEGLLFDPGASDEKLVDMVMKIARDYVVPIDPKDIKINSRGQDLIINMSYTDTVVLIPGIFEREWTFTPSTSTRLFSKGGRLK